MRTIHVKYDEVYAEVARLRSVAANTVNRVNNEYRQIQSQLGRVDGATNATLVEVMDANCQKAVLATETLDKLLEFISCSTKQIEINEQRIAQAMTAGRK